MAFGSFAFNKLMIPPLHHLSLLLPRPINTAMRFFLVAHVCLLCEARGLLACTWQHLLLLLLELKIWRSYMFARCVILFVCEQNNSRTH